MFRLALALSKTVGELETTLGARELDEWIAYDKLCPIGPERADINMGILAATIANSATGRRGRKAKAVDFIPQYDKPRRQSNEQIKATLMAFAAAHNATVEK